MTAPIAPRITAADLKAATTRLRAVLVLDVADLSIAPALLRGGVFETLEGELLGEDDGSLIVLADREQVDAYLERAGRAGEAAKLATRELVLEPMRAGLL